MSWVDLREFENCNRNNTLGYLVWALPQITAELKTARSIESLLRSLLSEDNMRDTFLTYNVGAEIIKMLDESAGEK